MSLDRPRPLGAAVLWSLFTLLAFLGAEGCAYTGNSGWGVFSIFTGTPRPVIFLQLPRSPLSLPDQKVPPRFVQSVAARPRISILPDGTFQDLEQPDLFADGVHLNRDGRQIFTTRLADHVAGFSEPLAASDPVVSG